MALMTHKCACSISIEEVVLVQRFRRSASALRCLALSTERLGSPYVNALPGVFEVDNSTLKSLPDTGSQRVQAIRLTLFRSKHLDCSRSGRLQLRDLCTLPAAGAYRDAGHVLSQFRERVLLPALHIQFHDFESPDDAVLIIHQ